MKNLKSLLLLLLFMNCVSKPTLLQYDNHKKLDLVIVSQRVGETIDSVEREQFNLFPGIEDFESAVFYKTAEYGYLVEIVTKDKTFHVRNCDDNGIEIMRAYVDDYDKNQQAITKLVENRKVERYIRDTIPIYEKIKTPFEEKWDIVDYDGLGLPITKGEITKFNEHRNARLYSVGCCLPTCIIGGLFTGMAMYNDSWNGESTATPFFLAGAGASIAGAAIGYIVGKKIDEKQTITAIKEARKPRIVERGD